MARIKLDGCAKLRRLGTERISKLLLKFSIPCVMGLLISAFFRGVKK